MKKQLIAACILLLGIPGTGFAQKSGLAWLQTVRFDEVRPYSEGRSAFLQNGKWGFTDPDGKAVVPAEFDEVTDFLNGMARVRKDGKWGVVNLQGKEIFPIVYDSIGTFNPVTALALENGKQVYLYADGKKRILPAKREFGPYSNGIARVKNRGRWGYINEKGYFIIDPQYDSASNFSGGYALVSRKGKQFFIDSKGRRHKVGFQVENTPEFHEGMSVIRLKRNFLSYLNTDLERIPALYLEARPFSEGLAYIRFSSGMAGYIGKDGRIKVNTTEYQDCGNFSGGLAWVQTRSGKFGYIDAGGKLVIDTLLTQASDFDRGLAYVTLDGRQGLIRKLSETDRFPRICITDIQLEDGNRNGIVEAEEAFSVRVTLRNEGEETAEGIFLNLLGDTSRFAGLALERREASLPGLLPGKDTVIRFNGLPSFDLISSDIPMDFLAMADNQLDSTQSSFSVKSVGINECRPLMEEFWIHTQDHSPVVKGAPFLFQLSVVNKGKGIAKDVKVHLKLPQDVSGELEYLDFGDLKPDERKEVTCNLFLAPEDSTNLQRDTYSIVAVLSEFTGKHSDTKYMNFETDKLNYSYNLLESQIQFPTGMVAQISAPAVQNTAGPALAGTSLPMQVLPSASAGPVTNAVSDSLLKLTETKELNKNRYALVIGNENYNLFKQSNTYEPNVDFAEQDARTFARFAVKRFGIPEQNIILLTNATYARMMRNINKLTRISSVNPGELELFVFYAGHGQVDAKTNEQYLIPVDVSLSDPTSGIRLEDFYSRLSNCNAKQVMVFLDACYSGVGRGIVLKAKETPVHGNMVIMTSSSASQRSMPYQEKQHGMFTYYLLKTLYENPADITLDRLFQTVRENVQNRSLWVNESEQTPQIICGPEATETWKEWSL